MQDTPEQKTVFDADQQQLGDVYAKALLAVGSESGKVDDLVDELDAVVDAVGELPKFQAALESPRVPVAAKQQMVEKAFQGKVSKDLLNFLKVLAGKDRFDCLRAIRAASHRMHDEMSGRAQGTLTTANAIDDETRAGIEAKLEKVLGRKVSLTCLVDPEIIGGMVVRVGDTVFDGSVANQLKQVRTKAIKAAGDSIRGSLEKFAIDSNS